MHEVSIVRALLSQAVEAAAPTPSTHIREIHITLGPLSGVESLLVQRAFSDLKMPAGMLDCKLVITEQELLAFCEHCECQFEVVNYVFRCPQCKSGRVAITQGDQLLLTKLEIEEMEIQKQ